MDIGTLVVFSWPIKCTPNEYNYLYNSLKKVVYREENSKGTP